LRIRGRGTTSRGVEGGNSPTSRIESRYSRKNEEKRLLKKRILKTRSLSTSTKLEGWLLFEREEDPLMGKEKQTKKFIVA